jgi:hypothetical protein
MQDVVIVGEAVAGESAKTRKALEKAIKQVNLSTFDVIELLDKIQDGRMYTTTTFDDYLKTLDFKLQKLKYLARIGEFMRATGMTRVEAEQAGVTKMRVISRLDPKATYKHPLTYEETPMLQFIFWLVQQAAHPEMTAKKLEEQVAILKGEIGEKSFTWLNIRVSRLLKTNVLDLAFEKAALNIGTVGTDKDGVAIQPSDAAKLEIICVAYLQDESENPEVQ